MTLRNGSRCLSQLVDATTASEGTNSQRQQQHQEQRAHLQPSDFIDLVLGHRSLADEFCYMNRSGVARVIALQLILMLE